MVYHKGPYLLLPPNDIYTYPQIPFTLSLSCRMPPESLFP